MHRALKIALPVVIVVAAAVGAGLWWFFSDDAPPEVSLESATESLDAGDGDAAAPVEGISGDWTVDSAAGAPAEADGGTFAGFRIQENLANIGAATAVGRTGAVDAEITIDDSTVTAATVDVDLSTITTNRSQRDSRVQAALETDRYPTATFTLVEPIELGDDAAGGDPVTARAAGDLTVHGVTRPATFELEARLVDGTVVVVGSAAITFSDFDVEVPTSPFVLSVDDSGVVELQLQLTKE